MFTTLCLLAGMAVQASPAPVLPEVAALQGTFTGQWTLYGIDANGEVVRKASWSDKLVTGPVVELQDRVYVTWVNEQTFDGAKGPPTRVEGKEGYFLKNGKLGDGFIEMFGETLRMVRLSENTSSYVVPASARELAMLGFPKDASGEHVLVRVTTKELEQPSHRVSRITTVRYVDSQGNPRTVQFVSLQGYHRKQP